MEFIGNSFDKSGNSWDLKGIRLTNSFGKSGNAWGFKGTSFDKSGNSSGIYREFV